MATEHTIAARTHGRYLVEPGPPERLLVGFHGFGERAESNLEQLKTIPGADQWTLVSVQALNRFYAVRTGEIVACWMTSQDRELAIADNIDYVRGVVAQFPLPQKLVFLGFSQGAAMAYRAAATHRHANGVIVLGGDAPPELTGPLPPVLIGRGTQEDWYTDEKLKHDLKFLASFTSVETCVFEGGHEWTDSFRTAAGEFLGRMAD